MDADLIKSVLGVIAAAIPLVIVIVAILRSRVDSTNEPNDNPSLKILKIKREPVEQKDWKGYKIGRSVFDAVFFFITIGLYWSLYYYASKTNNSVIIVAACLSFSFSLLLISVIWSKSTPGSFITVCKTAYNGRYFLFKSIYIEIEADYYFLFNKCHEALKSLNFQVVEIDADLGYLEACISHIHYLHNAGLIKVKVSQKNNCPNIYIISLDVEKLQTTNKGDILSQYSKVANRFVNKLISKPKDTQDKVKEIS